MHGIGSVGAGAGAGGTSTNDSNNRDAAAGMLLGEEEAFEKACRIWFGAPEGRAAQELRALPRDERERVWADLTGNQEISNFKGLPPEDPQELQRCFVELHRELVDFAHPQSKNCQKALSVVLRTNPAYVQRPEFMLQFLRARQFDVRSTLALLIRHFEMKRELFGPERIARDIVLSDLNEKDMEFMNHGAYQYLKGTDRAGRPMSFLNFADPSYSGKYNVLRCMFYQNTAAAEQESVQRLGIVRVGYFHQSYPRGGPDNELIRMSLLIIEAVPIRCVGLYLVNGSNLWSQTIEFMLLLATPFLRVRTRTVSGSYFENLYALMCLGIPQESFPAREDGSLKTENLQDWIAEQRSIEDQRQRR